jgi:hypothetical protein
MNKEKITVLAVMAAVVLTAAIFMVIFISAAAGNNAPPINLPPIPDNGGPSAGGSISDPDVSGETDMLIDITPDNFKTVLEKLRRPDGYSADAEIELFWSDGQSGLIRRGWFLGGFSRWQYFDGAGKPTENYIIGNGTTYIWEEGSDSYVSSPDAGITPDDVGQIPTYEDILSADEKDVLSASYEDIDGEPCVKTVIGESNNGLVRNYWVSIDKGILWRFEMTESEKPVYRMSVLPESFSGSEPDKSVFLLPDGSYPADGAG